MLVENFSQPLVLQTYLVDDFGDILQINVKNCTISSYTMAVAHPNVSYAIFDHVTRELSQE